MFPFVKGVLDFFDTNLCTFKVVSILLGFARHIIMKDGLFLERYLSQLITSRKQDPLGTRRLLQII